MGFQPVSAALARSASEESISLPVARHSPIHLPNPNRNPNRNRKPWIEQRIQFLAGVYGIDVLSFAILSNHFHLVLRNRPDVVATWGDTEVARRWLQVCPKRKTPTGEPQEPSASPKRASDKGCLPMSLPDYLALVDWTGRQIVAGKSNMPDHLPPILERLGMDATNWVPLIRNFGRLFHRVAGAPRTLDRHARWRRFRPGRAELLGTG